jgi:hypothetical protein
MGVKSTVRLTREEAERRFVELYVKRKENKIRAKAVALSDQELEDKLERWNDAVHDGEGFENYLIVQSHDEDN